MRNTLSLPIFILFEVIVGGIQIWQFHEDCSVMSGNERFDYGKAVQANCANCGVVQIPSRVSLNTSCPRCKGVLVLNTVDLHSQRRSTDNREQNLLLQDDNEDLENTTLAPSTEDSAELDTVSLQHLSLATDENLSGLPLQESFEASSSRRKASTYPSKLSKTPTEGNDENGINGVCQTCGELNSTHECLSCFIAVFKRGVISGKNRSLVVYIIPKEKFDLVFAKIVQNEAAAYEGTEIAVIDDKRTFFCYHPQMAIQNELTIIFKMDCGECFALISPASTTLGVQHVLAKSEERIFPGAHVKLVTAYVGEENTLREDKVRMALLSGQARLGILIPTKVHHTPTDVLDGLNYSGTKLKISF
ncbi:uncharacterized protein LOC111336431 isoform X1 [Stylophora pistillata]|uniref:uncharacterized protein LOC111336431 isoform X1 n=1 Tax=Stylophora pistillata TaxID=50429 RepID=UPI000C057840|nr:uncharacterized protein LOC111336431 isoform X1 [Stylophora pistillata]